MYADLQTEIGSRQGLVGTENVNDRRAECIGLYLVHLFLCYFDERFFDLAAHPVIFPSSYLRFQKYLSFLSFVEVIRTALNSALWLIAAVESGDQTAEHRIY